MIYNNMYNVFLPFFMVAIFIASLLGSTSSIAASHVDVAPISNEVFDKLIKRRIKGNRDPLPFVLKKKLLETNKLINDISKSSKDQLLTAGKRMQVDAKLNEWISLREYALKHIDEKISLLDGDGKQLKLEKLKNVRSNIIDRFNSVSADLDEISKAKDALNLRNKIGVFRDKYHDYGFGSLDDVKKAKIKKIKKIFSTQKNKKNHPLGVFPGVNYLDSNHLNSIARPIPTFRQVDPGEFDPNEVIPERTFKKSVPIPKYLSDGYPIAPVMYASLGDVMLAEPNAVPSEASQCNYLAADMEETIDVKFTPEIIELARELQYSPAAIFAYVTNNIRYENYYGSLKGSQATLISGAGNETDQSSLLIALLRASRIPARYIKGRIRFKNSDQRALDWLGVKSNAAARAKLKTGGHQGVWANTTTLAVEHVWVETCVPYGNYRGSAFDNTGHRWIPLDPSFKNIEYQDGIKINLDFDYETYLSTRNQDLPTEFYDDQVRDHIKSLAPNYSNNSIDDVPYVGNIIPKKVDVLPASLPYDVIEFLPWGLSTSAETSVLPAEHRLSMRISLEKMVATYTEAEILAIDPNIDFSLDFIQAALAEHYSTISLPMPEISLKRVTLSFADSYLEISKAESDYLYMNTPYSNTISRSAWVCKNRKVPVINIEGIKQDMPVIPGIALCYGRHKRGAYLFYSESEQKSHTEWGVVDDVYPLQSRGLNIEVVLGEDTSVEKVINSVEYDSIHEDEYHALQAYSFQASDRLLEQRSAKLLASVRSVADPSMNKEETIGEFLHLVGLKYMRYITDAGKKIGKQHGTTGDSGNHIGITSSASTISYLFDLSYGVTSTGFLIDVPGAVSAAVDIETGLSNIKAFHLTGYALSAYESYIWQENARMDAVSTVRGLQYANDQNIEVLTLDQSNIEIEKSKLTNNLDASLNYSDTSVNSIQSLVDSGSTITMPRSLIDYGNWKGQVYVATTDNTASFIIGQYAGGYTVWEPIDYWADSSWSDPFFDSSSTFMDTNTGWSLPTWYQSDYANYNLSTAPSLLSSAINYGSSTFTTLAGDPVNMVTGNMYHIERDITIKGRGGFPIVFERTYNSMVANGPVAPDAPLGYGWTHSLNHYLKFNDDDSNYEVDEDGSDNDGVTSSVTWFDGSGAQKFIEVSGNSSGVNIDSGFTNPDGFYFQLNRIANGRYTLREKNGTIYTFENMAGTVDQKARLVSINDSNGNSINLAYSGNRLSTVTDDLGRQLIFGYSVGSDDRIDSIDESWTSRRYEYKYDANGNLIEYRSPLVVAGKNTPVTYDYYSTADGENLNHVMQRYNLPRGNNMTFEYYTNGRVFRHFNSKGETMTFTYNDYRREATTVNERGFTQKYFFDSKGNPTKVVENNGTQNVYYYEDETKPMNRSRSVDALGYETQYSYDANGNVTTITYPSGTTTVNSHFNAYYQAGKVKDPNGNYTLYKFDAKGNTTDIIILNKSANDSIGAATDPSLYAPVEAQVLSWTKSNYDAYGNVTQVKQIRNFATQQGPALDYGYNDTVNGVVGLNAVITTECGDRDGDNIISSATECVTANSTFDNFGRLINGVSDNWYAIDRQYDEVDRVIKATDAVGNMRDTAYDANGNIIRKWLSMDRGDGVIQLMDESLTTYDDVDRAATTTNAGGFTSYYQYDAAGNVTKVTNPDGYSVNMTYDENNRAIRAYDEEGNDVKKEFDAKGRTRKVTDPNGSSTTFEYYGPEKDGRLKRQVDAAERYTEFNYDANGNVITVTDNLGRVTQTDYDTLNRAYRVVGPAFTDPLLGLVRPVTRYTYDKLGNLTDTDAGYTDIGGVTPASDVLVKQEQAGYDDFGQKLTITDGRNKVWSYEYDQHGNVTKIIDPKNQIIDRTYFYGGRLDTQTVRKSASDSSPHITSNTYNALGLITKVVAPEASYSYHYNKAHRVVAITDSRAGKRIQYEYSAGGMLNAMIDGEGNRTNYLYDAVGRLSGIWAANDDLVSFMRDAGGRLKEKWFPNGVNTRYTYNEDNSIKQVVNRSNNETILSQHDYTYNNLGQMDTHLESITGIPVSYKYEYDSLGRLTQIKDRANADTLIESYSYDAIGNRKSKTNYQGTNTTVAYVYDDANQLTEIRQNTTAGSLLVGFVYDDNGNLTKKCENGIVIRNTSNCAGDVITDLTYDALDRTVQVSKTGNPTENYQYDVQNRRIEKQVGTDTKRYRYAGPDIVAEYDDNWKQAIALYTHGPAWDDPLIREDSDNSTAGYYHQDGLGSVVAMSNAAGESTGSARYDAWGNTTSSTGDIPQYGYTGREPDNTGLIYYRARYYDPSVGRFTQRDPKGFIDGINRYAYAINSPVNYVDPQGTSVFDMSFSNDYSSSSSYYDTSSSLTSLNASFGGNSSSIISSGSQSLSNVTSTNKYAITDQQRKFASLGMAQEFWESRNLIGDPVAKAGLGSLNPSNNPVDYLIGGTSINNRLTAYDRVYGSGNQDVKQVRLDLMNAHVNTVDRDKSGVVGLLNPEQVAEYHHRVFRRYNLPPTTFGGTPFTGSVGEASWTRPVWCWGCDWE